MDVIRSLGEISLGSRLKRVSDTLMKQTQELYTDQNIDFDPYLFPAFYNIVKREQTTNNELIDALKTSQPAVTQTIKKLELRGLIDLTPDPIDKRKKTISPTPTGTKLFQRLSPIWEILDRTVKEFTQLQSDSLLAHIDHFEQALRSGTLMQTVKERIQKELTIEIKTHEPSLSKAFYDLNIEWLETYFYVEDFDRKVLSKPQQYILDPGGHIFYAIEGGITLGTVALKRIEDNLFELTKMAVSPEARGKGVGQKLMQHCIGFAKEENWKALLLYSNRILENAIHIYRKYGFEEIPVEPDSPYERSNIKMYLPLN